MTEPHPNDYTRESYDAEAANPIGDDRPTRAELANDEHPLSTSSAGCPNCGHGDLLACLQDTMRRHRERGMRGAA